MFDFPIHLVNSQCMIGLHTIKNNLHLQLKGVLQLNGETQHFDIYLEGYYSNHSLDYKLIFCLQYEVCSQEYILKLYTYSSTPFQIEENLCHIETLFLNSIENRYYKFQNKNSYILLQL
jgi:hypothetical protein